MFRQTALSVLFVALLPQPSSAAISKHWSNVKDVNEMMAFVRMHPLVGEQLKKIDLTTRTVHFGENCIAYFKVQQPEYDGPPMPGLLSSLVFDRATCPVDDEQ